LSQNCRPCIGGGSCRNRQPWHRHRGRDRKGVWSLDATVDDAQSVIAVGRARWSSARNSATTAAGRPVFARNFKSEDREILTEQSLWI